MTLSQTCQTKIFLNSILRQALVKSSNSLKIWCSFIYRFDDFKNINDLMGKETGNEILKEIADRFVSKSDKTSMISRLSSDKIFDPYRIYLQMKKKQQYSLKSLHKR